MPAGGSRPPPPAPETSEKPMKVAEVVRQMMKAYLYRAKPCEVRACAIMETVFAEARDREGPEAVEKAAFSPR